MNGPIKKASEKSLVARQDWLQHLVEAGGVIVFVGLLIEDGPELVEAISKHHMLPGRGVIGGIIVAVGVGIEVLFASLVTNVSKQLQSVADAKNIESQAEIERLRKENLEMVRLLSWRSIGDAQEFEKAMRPFAGTKFAFDVYRSNFVDDSEPSNLYAQLSAGLERAGWISARTPRRRMQLGPGVGVATVAVGESTSVPAAAHLAEWLHRCLVSVAQFVIEDEQLEPGTILISVGIRPETLAQLRIFEDLFQQGPIQPDR